MIYVDFTIMLPLVYQQCSFFIIPVSVYFTWNMQILYLVVYFVCSVVLKFEFMELFGLYSHWFSAFGYHFTVSWLRRTSKVP